MTLSKVKTKHSNACSIAFFGILVVGCTLLLPNSLLHAQNLIQPRVVLSGPKNANAEITNRDAQSENNLRSEGSNIGFSQMSIPQVPSNQNNVENRSTGRFLASEGFSTNQRQKQQPTRSLSTEPPQFKLETRPLSQQIVESSRRAINSTNDSANQDSPTANQNTQRRSGWGVANSESQANHHSINPYHSGQRSDGRNRVDRAVDYRQPNANAPIQHASFATDLSDNPNGNAVPMDSSKLLDTDLSTIDREIASPNGSVNTASGSDIPSSSRTNSAAKSKFEPSKKFSITNTVQKVAISTIVILFLSVVAIVVLKKLGYAGPVKKEHSEPEFDVIETKRISGKCQLQLVKIRNHKVIVGIDQSGIKSMVCLPQSFADEYDEATSSEAQLDETLGVESNTSPTGLNESSSVAELMATDVASLIEAERRKSMSGSQADQSAASKPNVFSKNEIRTDEPESTRSTLRRKPIRRFHPYEIAGGGNSTE